MHEEEMNKILVYLKGFSEDERNRLAQVKFYSIISFSFEKCGKPETFLHR